EDFALANTLFDPVGRPDTKWEVPPVLGIREYQVDLVRAPMKGFDIKYDGNGNATIAVLKQKASGPLEKKDLDDAKKALKRQVNRGGTRYAQNQQNRPQQPGIGPMGPGLGGPMGPGLGGPTGPPSPAGE